MESIRVVIAEDDEEQAEGIALLVQRLRSNFKVQKVVHTQLDLMNSLEELVPDILLLDLHMPDSTTGSPSILEMMKASSMTPIVIMITGDPTKAVEAYESDVADYVVKPVRPLRLAQALDRAESMLYARKGGGRPTVPLSVPQGSHPVGEWLTGSRGRDIILIDPSEIIYLQAERKYTNAYMSTGHVLMRFGITEVEEKLDMTVFLRIHRSTIVHRKHIDFLRRDEMGRLRVHVKGRSESLVVSRSFEQLFKGV